MYDECVAPINPIVIFSEYNLGAIIYIYTAIIGVRTSLINEQDRVEKIKYFNAIDG